ncbi:histidinol-phosphate transaminase [Robertmurraya sp. DFI.2.37]|uniref:histidinol-phosphate transaminase n=1 Tax=Robertmurraya sp. DFI.2.37 TaxID=3031819 RepID=UPI0012473F38|nr:histidinol-phosphate transaminase [Robertmurraya sp. DFI.2.37]MDF1507728.1 histidinol-phosphate transaminase [Robertmurraya sp. DFI.2.37]
MRWKEELLQLTPYQPGKSIAEVKRQYGLEKIVKLASNENPFGCSQQVLDKIRQFAGSLALYPDGYATDLRGALASKLGVLETQFIFGNGSDENIQIISRALLRPGFNTVMATPTFPQYKHNALIEGAEVREVPLINGEHDLEGMLKQMDERTNVVWLCSPNNPTGTYINEKKLLSFLKRVPQETLVVLDEAYYEYVVAEDYYHSIELIKQFENLLVLRTFSKIYGLASLRVGYGIGSEKVIRALEPAREPFNTNTFAQIAARAALEDQAYVEMCRQRNREGLEQYYQFCEQEQLSYNESQGNFILIDFKMDGNEVFQYCLERGYIVRSGAALGFPTSVRVTVGSKEENDEMIAVMKAFISEKSPLDKQ